VKGEKKAEHDEKNGGVWYAERRYGSFSRSMRLPFEVTDENVDARFENGVLVIRIPKPAEAQKSMRRIEVKSA
jgi:HSP20 family protein